MDGEVTVNKPRTARRLGRGRWHEAHRHAAALRLIPLADDVGRMTRGRTDGARPSRSNGCGLRRVGRLERLRRHGGDVDEVLAWPPRWKVTSAVCALAAAYHHAALLHHANQSWEEAHALVSRSLAFARTLG